MKSVIISLLFMLNFMTAFSITLAVVLLLDSVMPRRSHSCTQFIGMFLKYSGAVFTLSQRLKIIYLVFEALNSMSCVNAKLSHFSNISTILALDGANSVMSLAYINIILKSFNIWIIHLFNALSSITLVIRVTQIRSGIIYHKLVYYIYMQLKLIYPYCFSLEDIYLHINYIVLLSHKYVCRILKSSYIYYSMAPATGEHGLIALFTFYLYYVVIQLFVLFVFVHYTRACTCSIISYLLYMYMYNAYNIRMFKWLMRSKNTSGSFSFYVDNISLKTYSTGNFTKIPTKSY